MNMAEQIYPKGLRVWPPREGAPEFVKGKISIHLETFQEWAQKHLDEKGFIAFDLKEGRDGIYATLNTYKKPPPKQEREDNDREAEQRSQFAGRNRAANKYPKYPVDDINPDDIPFN